MNEGVNIKDATNKKMNSPTPENEALTLLIIPWKSGIKQFLKILKFSKISQSKRTKADKKTAFTATILLQTVNLTTFM